MSAGSISPKRPPAGSLLASLEVWPSVHCTRQTAAEGALRLLGSHCEVVVRSQKFYPVFKEASE